ncbi:MAG: GNAT family N-acetyltransferase [Thaumarchaeota archaeon]|nr:GNAT family N-acetyltransferase [Nitrososphaerota archaeon]
MRLVVRRGRRSDSRPFLQLLLALAKFEKLPEPNSEAKRRIIRDIFENKAVNLMVALADGRISGYALYYFAYSSFLARPTLYLEDLFVPEEKRRRGTGGA